MSLTGREASICEQGLSCDPLAFRAEKFDDRRNVFDVGQTVAHGLAFKEGHRLGRFLGIEEC